MPVHGMLSTVTPAYHCYGQGAFASQWGNSSDGMGSARAFPSWFGKNSTQGKLQRYLTEIQIRMRLKVSGDRREIRQSYLPGLHDVLVKPLMEEGAEAIEDVIAVMDEYFLTKEEWDGMVELGIGELEGEKVLKEIDSKVKGAFTRKYNTTDHPIPFHKATEISAAKRMGGAAEKPDLEEAHEVEPEVDDDDEDAPKKLKKGEDEKTIHDKLVKAKKPKKETAASKAKAAGGAKKTTAKKK